MVRRVLLVGGALFSVAYLAWIALLTAATYGGPPGATDLDQTASELRSIALEATLLDTQAEHSRTTEAYRRSSAWELENQASQATGSISVDAYERALRPRARRIARLGSRVAAAVRPLRAATITPAGEERVRVVLRRLAEELARS